MPAYCVGQKVHFASQEWTVSRVWDTNTAGLRVNMHRKDDEGEVCYFSVNVGDLELWGPPDAP